MQMLTVTRSVGAGRGQITPVAEAKTGGWQPVKHGEAEWAGLARWAAG